MQEETRKPSTCPVDMCRYTVLILTHFRRCVISTKLKAHGEICALPKISAASAVPRSLDYARDDARLMVHRHLRVWHIRRGRRPRRPIKPHPRSCCHPDRLCRGGNLPPRNASPLGEVSPQVTEGFNYRQTQSERELPPIPPREVRPFSGNLANIVEICQKV